MCCVVYFFHLLFYFNFVSSGTRYLRAKGKDKHLKVGYTGMSQKFCNILVIFFCFLPLVTTKVG